MPKLILIGGGGHCRSCIDVIESAGEYVIEGILDRKEKLGEWILKYKVIGNDDDIDQLSAEGYYFLITVGQVKSAAIRKGLFEKLKVLRANIATIISPHAYLSKYAEIDTGSIIMHGVQVNAGAKIGTNCILNSGCTIEHDATIGNHCHISTHAIVNGGALIGDETFVGSNATISHQVKLGRQLIIGAGTVVNKDIPMAGTYAGNPAKKI